MKYGIDTRAIFSLTRYQMLAYCCRTKKFIVKVPPFRIGDGTDEAKEASAARGSDALAGGLDWYLRLTSGTSGRTP